MKFMRVKYMDKLPIDQLFCGDVVRLSKELLPDSSIHGISTDPPYGLEFMGEEWDKFRDGDKSRYFHRPDTETARGFGAKDFGTPIKVLPRSPEGKALLVYQSWTTSWAREALRVLKPGASMLVMGGTRTHHRMMCGVEDAGFIIKDMLLHCYNSGFPKSQDLGKMLDKRNERNWRPEVKDYLNSKRKEKGLSFNQINKMLGTAISGGGTASTLMGDKRFNELPTQDIYNKLKVILDLDNRFDELIERKEAERKIIGLKTNGKATSGICYRMNGMKQTYNETTPALEDAKKWDGWKVGGLKPSYEPIIWAVKPPEGAIIDNVLKHGVGAANVDACRIPYDGEDDIHGKNPHTIHKVEANYGIYSPYADQKFEVSERGRYPSNMIRTDRFHDGYDRFYFVPKAGRAERDEGLEGLPLKELKTHGEMNPDTTRQSHNTTGQQPAKAKNIHPTVKPVALMEHLIKLVTRKGQIVLDPFVGSGTTCIAARKLLRHYIGFDNNAEYIKIAKHRLAAVPKPLEDY